MINKICFRLTLIICICLLGAGCDRASRTEMEGTTGTTGKQSAPKQSDEVAGMDLNARGRGRGRGRLTAPGRGLGRGQGRYNPITLSPSEEGAIEIETVKATYKSLRNLLPAMGKVLAPQTKTAIVSYAFPARIAQIRERPAPPDTPE